MTSDKESLKTHDKNGLLEIGNGEKCPFCDTVMTEETDTLQHLTENHEKELMKTLFRDEQ